MKNILLIATGGTIASRPTDGGLTPQLRAKDILDCVPQLESLCRISALQLRNIDSTNMSPDCWLKIAACVKENYDQYDGFVITHGTDTMSYTACALSYLIQNSAKPIVLTGSQKSIYDQETDARRNLYDAFLAAQDELVDPEHSRLLARALEQAGIPCRLEIGPTGGHGFADGTGMCMDGWTKRAIDWYEHLE